MIRVVMRRWPLVVIAVIAVTAACVAGNINHVEEREVKLTPFHVQHEIVYEITDSIK